MNTELHPIGTEVFKFRDSPFLVLKGKIIEHIDNPIFNYRCEWYDPILDGSYTEFHFDVFLTEKEANDAHQRITDIFFKHRKTSR